jgi:hypothetical protein
MSYFDQKWVKQNGMALISSNERGILAGRDFSGEPGILAPRKSSKITRNLAGTPTTNI